MSFRKPAAFLQSTSELNRETSSTGENGLNLVVAPRSSSSLPILDHADRIVYALEKYPVLIIVGGTGCGKSTQIPRILDRAGWTQKGQCIACTQPRRLSAITLSKRVSEEMNVNLGEKVGYSVRFDEQCNKRRIHTSIKYITELMLIRETLMDPLLSKYSVIMIDDAHERSIQGDVLLGLLKKILQHRRSDFKVIISSATMHINAFRDFFEVAAGVAASKSKRVCVLNTSKNVHPVDILYLQRPCANYLIELVDTVISIATRESNEGDILCFLPASEDVERAVHMLEERLGVNDSRAIFVIPLHSGLPISVQRRIFENPLQAYQAAHNQGHSAIKNSERIVRKCIIATNIAESSITIPGIRYVIDSGFTQSRYFDVRSGIESLITRVVTRAEAEQRAGRAGRTHPGRCFRLMTEEHYLSSLYINDYPTAEMQRVDVTWVVLQLKALGIDDILHFDFMSPPSPASMIHALDILYSLGALDETCTLTKTGQHMADLPMNPQLSKCLVASLDPSLACGVEMLTICAMCSVGYPFFRAHQMEALRHSYDTYKKLKIDYSTVVDPTRADLLKFLSSRTSSFTDRTSDHITLLSVYQAFEENGSSKQWCDMHCIQYQVLKEAKEVRMNLYRLLRNYEEEVDGLAQICSCDGNPQTIRKCLVSGLFANVAKLGTDGHYHTIRAALPVRIHQSSAIIQQYQAYKQSFRRGVDERGLPEWILYNEVLSSAFGSFHMLREKDGPFDRVKDVVVVRDVSSINPQWLVEVSGHYYHLLT